MILLYYCLCLQVRVMDPTTSEELKQGTLTAPMELQMAVKEENYRTARSLKGIVMKVSALMSCQLRETRLLNSRNLDHILLPSIDLSNLIRWSNP